MIRWGDVSDLPYSLSQQGGHGLHPFSHNPPAHLSNPPINQSDSALTYHHDSFFASCGPPRGPVSVLGYLLSERRLPLPSPLPLRTHLLYLRSQLRFSRSQCMVGHQPCICTFAVPPPQILPIPSQVLITPPPPSSIHSWMVRTCLLLI